jgi:hypothetical protein
MIYDLLWALYIAMQYKHTPLSVFSLEGEGIPN